ncbi:hypothetical protein NDU88_003056 [Pleurodeles waltl]|uniref:Uncharacterized protein n=1 Tax=Pleurodeles waltl TaxID=8319 RepID=A0AAV7TPF9_PLEWA|nr:hypothetical protein NDU88_003056 [Pleurodeles waltl]
MRKVRRNAGTATQNKKEDRSRGTKYVPGNRKETGALTSGFRAHISCLGTGPPFCFVLRFLHRGELFGIIGQRSVLNTRASRRLLGLSTSRLTFYFPTPSLIVR